MADEQQTAALEQELVGDVEVKARALCEAVNVAIRNDVSQALLLPSLISVFREAGMIPQDLDLSGLMGLLR